MFIFVILGLLVCTEAQGISAGAPVFVLKGEDFLLNVTKAVVLNIQYADSGVYTAVVAKDSKEVLAKYNVKVQDRASLPLLTVSSVSSNCSSCSFSLTCSSQDSHINSTFTCETRTCSQEGGERSEGIPDTFLQVHQSSGSIICNHSNHVSWTNDTKTIKDVCHQLVDPEGLSVCLVKTCVFSVGLIIMVSAVITVHLMEKLNKNK
ncbi:SLAM family member 5 [Dissostichus eleginoides]|uniref:SLAM family member 5 n=1 Tax=Dissostichus eleginoides TaxID=100907 RepID=A0AAD9BAL7_DISEL|nr:SLAM family member 5 [Dissostichus eleginoides]